MSDRGARGDLSRRDALKLGAAATIAASLGLVEPAAAQAPGAAPGFFTAAELALVDELSELIIPTDAHSPGAKAAKVAAFIDGRLAEAFAASERTDWRNGLSLVDRLSREINGKPFMTASEPERVAILTRMARNESNPKAPEEVFFKELKSRVVYAYYTSEIGIKQEMEYKGNTYLAEFVGTDVSR